MYTLDGDIYKMRFAWSKDYELQQNLKIHFLFQ